MQSISVEEGAIGRVQILYAQLVTLANNSRVVPADFLALELDLRPGLTANYHFRRTQLECFSRLAALDYHKSGHEFHVSKLWTHGSADLDCELAASLARASRAASSSTAISLAVPLSEIMIGATAGEASRSRQRLRI